MQQISNTFLQESGCNSMLSTKLDRKNNDITMGNTTIDLSEVGVVVDQVETCTLTCFELLMTSDVPSDIPLWSCRKEQENKTPFSNLVSWYISRSISI